MAKNDIDKRRRTAMQSVGCVYSKSRQGWIYKDKFLGRNHTVAFKHMVEIGIISNDAVPKLVKSAAGAYDRMRAK